MRRRALIFFAAISASPGPHARAEVPAPVRLRGKIIGLTDQSISIESGDGGKDVQLNKTLPLMVVTKARWPGVVPGSYVGVATRVGTGGAREAFSVLLYAPVLRGQSEGSYDSDLAAEVRVTNGTLKQIKSGHDGARLLTIAARGEISTILVPKDARIATLGRGKRDDLQPGLPVLLIGVRANDGRMVALRVAVGRDGTQPAL